MRNLHSIQIPTKRMLAFDYWATEDGREIPFEELSVQHMLNILNKFTPLIPVLPAYRLDMLQGVVDEAQRRVEADEELTRHR